MFMFCSNFIQAALDVKTPLLPISIFRNLKRERPAATSCSRQATRVRQAVLLLFNLLSASSRVGLRVSLSERPPMNPLHWRREYQIAWIAFCLIGAMAGLFFAWTESPVRTLANYTMDGDPARMFFLWLLHPSRYWQWPLFGAGFVGLTFYAAMLMRAQTK